MTTLSITLTFLPILTTSILAPLLSHHQPLILGDVLFEIEGLVRAE